MRAFSKLGLAAVLSVAATAVSAEPLTDADFEDAFYNAAHSALSETLPARDDATDAHLFQTAAQTALVQVLATPDEAVYARDFYNAARAALEAHPAGQEEIQALN